MKLGFTADVHAHNWSAFSTRLPNGMNSRLADILYTFEIAAQTIQQQKLRAFFILGDLHEARVRIDMDVYSATYRALRRLKEIASANDCGVYLVRGNHDCFNKSGSFDSLEPYRDFLDVIDQPKTFSLPEIFAGVGPDVSIAAFPWQDDEDSLRSALSTMPVVDLVLIHAGIREASIGPYGMTGHGVLGTSDFPDGRFKFVLAGDYHKRQFFGPGNRFHYIGSPCQLSFGEAGEEKGLTVLDTDDWSFTTVPIGAPKFFKVSSVTDFTNRSNAGEIRAGIDFVRIECSAEHSAEAEEFAAYLPTVTVETIDNGKEALVRADSRVVDSDSLLIDEFCRMRAPEPMRERFAHTGRELLFGD